MKPKNLTFTNFLITLCFVFIPALSGYFFLLPVWFSDSQSWWFYLIVSFGFFIYVLIISGFFIFFRITNLNILKMNVPLALILIVIFVSASSHIAIRIVLVAFAIALTYPTNAFVDHFKQRYHNN